MTDTAAAQLRRVLAMIPELADDEEHGIRELARDLGVSRETLLADLCALTERFDDPAGFIGEGVALFIENERVSLTSSHFRRPMRVTAAELCALELGLAMLEGERPPEDHRAIGRARERLRAAIAKLPPQASVAEPGDRHATLANDGSVPEHLTLAREAVRTRRKLRLDYRRGDGRRSGPRVVCPYALVVASGAWYVVAYCERTEGVRVFRLDRVDRAEATGESFEVPESFSLEAVLRDGKVLSVDRPQTMTVRYSPRIARWIAERAGGELGVDGSLTMEHPLADPDWAVRHVLQYGPDAEVLAPESVRGGIVRRLGAMTADGARGAPPIAKEA